MAISLDSTSRFRETEPVIKDRRETFGLWNRPEQLIEENLNEEEMIRLVIDQRTAGRPDIISQEQYGTPFYDWIIIMFNRPQNTMGFPRAGTVIKIPTSAVVRRLP